MAYSKSLEVGLGEGESKVCKTTVISDMRDALEARNLTVVQVDAGSFFRKTTSASLEELNARGITDPTAADLATASKYVLDAGIPQDVTREWPPLHAPIIDNSVAIVSAAEHVQEAGSRWWGDVADQAVSIGADVLLLDGRNGRERLGPWMQEQDIVPAFEVFCVCDSHIAGERTLLGRGEVPTPAAIQIEAESIMRRRQTDRSRPVEAFPYHDPMVFVPFDPEAMTMHDALKLASDLAAPDGGPAAIQFDTAVMDRDAMRIHAQSLALGALGLIE